MKVTSYSQEIGRNVEKKERVIVPFPSSPSSFTDTTCETEDIRAREYEQHILLCVLLFVSVCFRIKSFQQSNALKNGHHTVPVVKQKE